MFDFKDYVTKHIDKVTVNSTNQLICTCPWCDKPIKLYVDCKTGNYICFSCNVKGRGLIGLVARFEGLSNRQAREFISQDESSLIRELTLSEMLEKIRPKEKPPEKYKVDIPLPDGVIPIFDGKVWRFPSYLKKRGIPRAVAHKFELGFVDYGYFGGRVILPIRCPNGESFTARDITGKHAIRYLNPKQAGHAKLISGWNQCDFSKHIIIVEGFFDVIQMHIHGFQAIALNGKRLHDAQATMLWTLPSDLHITIMLDAEAVVDAVRTAQILSDRFENIDIAQLPEGLDPGDSTYSQAMTAVMNAKDYTLFGGLKSRLDEIKTNFSVDNNTDIS